MTDKLKFLLEFYHQFFISNDHFSDYILSAHYSMWHSYYSLFTWNLWHHLFLAVSLVSLVFILHELLFFAHSISTGFLAPLLFPLYTTSLSFLVTSKVWPITCLIQISAEPWIHILYCQVEVSIMYLEVINKSQIHYMSYPKSFHFLIPILHNIIINPFTQAGNQQPSFFFLISKFYSLSPAYPAVLLMLSRKSVCFFMPLLYLKMRKIHYMKG